MKLLKNNESFQVIIPKQIVLAKQWKFGDLLEAIINKDRDIVLKKK